MAFTASIRRYRRPAGGAAAPQTQTQNCERNHRDPGEQRDRSLAASTRLHAPNGDARTSTSQLTSNGSDAGAGGEGRAARTTTDAVTLVVAAIAVRAQPGHASDANLARTRTWREVRGDRAAHPGSVCLSFFRRLGMSGYKPDAFTSYAKSAKRCTLRDSNPQIQGISSPPGTRQRDTERRRVRTAP